MNHEDCLYFDSFVLETRKLCLWHGEHLVPMRRQTLMVLLYLASRPAQIISKEELLQQLWHGTHVSHSAPRVCIREIRHALGEQTHQPKYIETVGYEGYRFCAEVRGARQPIADATLSSATRVMGRQKEMVELQQALHQSLLGSRQLVLIRGEMGLGKTALAETFLAACEAGGQAQAACGHGIENSAFQMPLLPLFDALEQLCNQAQGDVVRSVLHQYAPMCQNVLPSLSGLSACEPAQNQVDGMAQTQLFLELARALEAISAQKPLILFLDDLHACDDVTLTFISFLMQRRETARLLMLGAYRPEAMPWQPVRVWQRLQALQSVKGCLRLHLDRLCQEEVAAYAEARLGGAVGDALVALLWQQTEGHPLCVVEAVNDWQQRGWLSVRAGCWTTKTEASVGVVSVPPPLRHHIMKQCQGLKPEVQQILKAASVSDDVFEAVRLAERLEMRQEEVERRCQELSESTSLLEGAGVAHWSDATVSGRYRFRYRVYRHVISEWLSAWEWMQLQSRLQPGAEPDRLRQASGIWQAERPFVR